MNDQSSTNKYLADFAKSGELFDICELIGKKYSLLIDQIGDLCSEVSGVVLGISKSQDFVNNITKRLEINRKTAENITEEINEKVFSILKSKYTNQQPAPNPTTTPQTTFNPQQPIQNPVTIPQTAFSPQQPAQTTFNPQPVKSTPPPQPIQPTQPNQSLHQDLEKAGGFTIEQEVVHNPNIPSSMETYKPYTPPMQTPFTRTPRLINVTVPETKAPSIAPAPKPDSTPITEKKEDTTRFVRPEVSAEVVSKVKNAYLEINKETAKSVAPANLPEKYSPDDATPMVSLGEDKPMPAPVVNKSSETEQIKTERRKSIQEQFESEIGSLVNAAIKEEGGEVPETVSPTTKTPEQESAEQKESVEETKNNDGKIPLDQISKSTFEEIAGQQNIGEKPGTLNQNRPVEYGVLNDSSANQTVTEEITATPSLNQTTGENTLKTSKSNQTVAENIPSNSVAPQTPTETATVIPNEVIHNIPATENTPTPQPEVPKTVVKPVATQKYATDPYREPIEN